MGERDPGLGRANDKISMFLVKQDSTFRGCLRSTDPGARSARSPTELAGFGRAV